MRVSLKVVNGVQTAKGTRKDEQFIQYASKEAVKRLGDQSFLQYKTIQFNVFKEKKESCPLI